MIVNNSPPCGNYLRVRGEYSGAHNVTRCHKELPPRARRIRFMTRASAMKLGTTSACAENTALLPLGPDTTWNYLRVRGEYGGRHYVVAMDRGTTSACAENTYRAAFTIVHDWNYLRVRGEYCGFPCACRRRWELPPRARRIRPDRYETCRRRGTTSACAENTYDPYRSGRPPWNYLRVRGEYIVNRVDHKFHWELPPRARRIPE